MTATKSSQALSIAILSLLASCGADHKQENEQLRSVIRVIKEKDSELRSENQTLVTKVHHLESLIARLELTPEGALNGASSIFEQGDLPGAIAAFEGVAAKFPSSPEALTAANRIDAISKLIAEKEEARLKVVREMKEAREKAAKEKERVAKAREEERARESRLARAKSKLRSGKIKAAEFQEYLASLTTNAQMQVLFEDLEVGERAAMRDRPKIMRRSEADALTNKWQIMALDAMQRMDEVYDN
jgi:hypothetical protein